MTVSAPVRAVHFQPVPLTEQLESSREPVGQRDRTGRCPRTSVGDLVTLWPARLKAPARAAPMNPRPMTKMREVVEVAWLATWLDLL